jgi:hypothetical protein
MGLPFGNVGKFWISELELPGSIANYHPTYLKNMIRGILMNQSPITSEERYAAIVETLRHNDITHAESTSRATRHMRVNHRIFAMLDKGNLVVRLPRGRVDTLIASGDAAHFVPDHGRAMKDWIAVGEGSQEDWMSLVHEARDFSL